jgi:hypothetical protein
MGPALPDGSLGVVLLRGLVSDPRLQCPVRSPVRCLVMDLGFVRLVRLGRAANVRRTFASPCRTCGRAASHHGSRCKRSNSDNRTHSALLFQRSSRRFGSNERFPPPAAGTMPPRINHLAGGTVVVLGEMALKAENPSQNSRTQFMLLPVLTGVSPVLALHNEHRRQGRSTRRCHHILTIIGNDLKNMNFYLHTFRLRDATPQNSRQFGAKQPAKIIPFWDQCATAMQ